MVPRDELSGKMHFKPSEYMPSKLHSALKPSAQPSPMDLCASRSTWKLISLISTTLCRMLDFAPECGSYFWCVQCCFKSRFYLRVHFVSSNTEKHVICFSSFLSGSWQLGNYRRAENRPNQCPETRQTRRLYAEEKKMAFKRLAQGTIFIVFIFRSSSSWRGSYLVSLGGDRWVRLHV